MILVSRSTERWQKIADAIGEANKLPEFTIVRTMIHRALNVGSTVILFEPRFVYVLQTVEIELDAQEPGPSDVAQTKLTLSDEDWRFIAVALSDARQMYSSGVYERSIRLGQQILSAVDGQ